MTSMKARIDQILRDLMNSKVLMAIELLIVAKANQAKGRAIIQHDCP
ncbi:MAG: hypothetical protein O2821_04620 [Chloroflexi bacterium]|nr:hypothetical protein [Chloroflexota bacterium]MDA1226385.1 hypothetical protein [Chloroflexota bacterium]